MTRGGMSREPSFLNPFTPSASFARLNTMLEELETAHPSPLTEADAVRAKMDEAAAAREAATAASAARRIGVGGHYNHAATKAGDGYLDRLPPNTPSRADADQSTLLQFETVAGTRPARSLKDRDLLSPFEQL